MVSSHSANQPVSNGFVNFAGSIVADPKSCTVALIVFAITSLGLAHVLPLATALGCATLAATLSATLAHIILNPCAHNSQSTLQDLYDLLGKAPVDTIIDENGAVKVPLSQWIELFCAGSSRDETICLTHPETKQKQWFAQRYCDRTWPCLSGTVGGGSFENLIKSYMDDKFILDLLECREGPLTPGGPDYICFFGTFFSNEGRAKGESLVTFSDVRRISTSKKGEFERELKTKLLLVYNTQGQLEACKLYLEKTFDNAPVNESVIGLYINENRSPFIADVRIKRCEDGQYVLDKMS